MIEASFYNQIAQRDNFHLDLFYLALELVHDNTQIRLRLNYTQLSMSIRGHFAAL